MAVSLVKIVLLSAFILITSTHSSVNNMIKHDQGADIYNDSVVTTHTISLGNEHSNHSLIKQEKPSDLYEMRAKDLEKSPIKECQQQPCNLTNITENMFLSLKTFNKTKFDLLRIQRNSKRNIFLAEGRHMGTKRDLNRKKWKRLRYCNKTFHKYSGMLFFNFESQNDGVCQWGIIAGEHERIQLNIIIFSINVSSTCENNYLYIRQGFYHIPPSTGDRYCGKQSSVPNVITTYGNRMWIEVKSDGGLSELSANYKILCGGDIKMDEGFINSPGYPKYKYPPDCPCLWKITVKENFFVSLQFIELTLEPKDAFNDKCMFDYVFIYEEYGNTRSETGKYCDFTKPKDIIIPRNEVFIQFISDKTNQYSGFSIHFQAERNECETKEHNCHHACINTIGSYKCTCSIFSPNYSQNYSLPKECIWFITVPKEYNISLNFRKFNMQCPSAVSVDLYGDNDPNKIKHFCSFNKPNSMISNSNVVKIIYKSVMHDVNQDFEAHFSKNCNKCDENNGGCSHYYQETIGSYICLCDEGYTLDDDQRTCVPLQE
ncbi:tolloid protein 1 [Biomphalaria glabrata]|nr:tolloid protein 1 [Biomphalaria glabrata]